MLFLSQLGQKYRQSFHDLPFICRLSDLSFEMDYLWRNVTSLMSDGRGVTSEELWETTHEWWVVWSLINYVTNDVQWVRRVLRILCDECDDCHEFDECDEWGIWNGVWGMWWKCDECEEWLVRSENSWVMSDGWSLTSDELWKHNQH